MVYDSVYEANKYFRVPTIPVLAPTLEDNFSSSSAWTITGTEVVIDGSDSNKVVVTGTSANGNTEYAYSPLGSTLTTGGLLNFKFKLLSASGNAVNYEPIFLHNKLSGNPHTTSTGFESMGVGINTNLKTMYPMYKDTGDNGWRSDISGAVTLSTNTDYWVSVSLASDGVTQSLKIYTNEARTTQHGSTQTTTIPIALTDLKSVIISTTDFASGGGYNASYEIDDLKIYDGVTTPTPAHPDVRRQHFWEYFSGSKLQEGVTGTNSYSTNFSSSSGWTSRGSQVSITGGVVDTDFGASDDNSAVMRSLGYDISGDFELRFKHRFISYTSSTSGMIALADTTNPVYNPTTAGSNSVMVGVNSDSSGAHSFAFYSVENGVFTNHGDAPISTGKTGTVSNATDYWIKMTKVGNLVTINVYSNSSYSSLVTSCYGSVSSSFPSTLNSIQIGMAWTMSGRGAHWTDTDLSLTSDAIGGTRWRTNKTTGNTGTATMNDTVDGGLKIYAGNSGADMTAIDFNDKRQFSPTASTCIVIGKTTASKQGGWGMLNTVSSGIHGIKTVVNSVNTDPVRLYTSDGSTESAQTSTSFLCSTAQASFNTYQMLLASSNAYLSINGVLEATKSNNMPTLSMQPFAYARLSLAYTYVRYMECYNT